MHILSFTSLFPNSIQKVHAVFVRNRMEAYTQIYKHDWTVVAPIPYAPKILGNFSKKYEEFISVPHYEEPWGYPIHHPRYFLTPKVGMKYYGDWMYQTLRKSVHNIHSKKKIDAIDAHYIFPDSYAAVKIATELNIPIVISARGTDLNLFPNFPAVRKKIIWAMEKANHIIHVCSDLQDVALNMGISPQKMSVIGNGINPDIFSPISKIKARERLSLPQDKKIWLSVGHQTERKGFHIIIESFSNLSDKNSLLVLVGDGPQRNELVQLCKQNKIEDRVLFAGAIENKDLRNWYGAADYFALASSREGWPNVLCEAQAMGLPIIATKVWGIPEIVYNAELGILVEKRAVEPLAIGMEKAMKTSWNNEKIQSVGQSRTWETVAQNVHEVFQNKLGLAL